VPDDVRNDFISYKIGDDRPLSWELLELDGGALAAGSYAVRAQVRAGPGLPVLHEWSTANDRAEIVSTGTGTVEDQLRWWVQLLVDDSRAWTWERGEYDLYITDPQGRDQPIVEGTWVNRYAITVTGDA